MQKSSIINLESLSAKYGRSTAVRVVLFPDEAEALGVSEADFLNFVEGARSELKRASETEIHALEKEATLAKKSTSPTR